MAPSKGSPARCPKPKAVAFCKENGPDGSMVKSAHLGGGLVAGNSSEVNCSA